MHKCKSRLTCNTLMSTHIRLLSGKCKINCKAMCRPTHHGSMADCGILRLGKFACTLLLRWPWFDWRERNLDKLWNGLGSSCDSVDMDLYYASTTSIVIGNGGIGPLLRHPMTKWHERHRTSYLRGLFKEKIEC